jgi:polyribonucleotide nucleotidyltransferase
VRVVPEITELDGSSEATICGTSPILMDTAVSTMAPAAEIGMGFIKDEDEYLLGVDFKVAGTSEGVTSQ